MKLPFEIEVCFNIKKKLKLNREDQSEEECSYETVSFEESVLSILLIISSSVLSAWFCREFLFTLHIVSNIFSPYCSLSTKYKTGAAGEARMDFKIEFPEIIELRTGRTILPPRMLEKSKTNLYVWGNPNLSRKDS